MSSSRLKVSVYAIGCALVLLLLLAACSSTATPTPPAASAQTAVPASIPKPTLVPSAGPTMTPTVAPTPAFTVPPGPTTLPQNTVPHIPRSQSGPLSTAERLAWSKQNVYDPETDTYYIPYHLWTGAYWDGNKNENVILQSADTVFLVNGVSETRINGPETWRHPYLDKEFKVYRRTKSNRDKVQLFVFHENGIGRVYDHRPTRSYDRYYDGKEVKFPAGWGWKIGVPQTFSFTIWDNGKKRSMTTTIEITAIEFDHESVMTALKYNYSVNGILDHKYVYSPRKGMVVAREQSERARLETPEQVKEAIAALSKEQQDCLRRLLGDGAFAELKSGARLPTQEEFRQAEECIAR